MLVGPLATKNEIARYKERIETSPEKFIAQPMLALSTNPTYVNRNRTETRRLKTIRSAWTKPSCRSWRFD